MKRISMIAGSATTGVLIAGTVAGTAFAWHPKGTIVKSAQNQTTKSAVSDANTDSTAVSATTGDTVLYTVTVSNNGAPAANNYDDMSKTVMTDTLPAGVELVSNPSTRTLTENMGTILPGKSVTKTYAVRVTSTKDGDVITNKACFTGNSIVNDNPQSGCDNAVVKVHVKPTPTPTPTPTPVTPTAELPDTLPDTGSTALSASIVIAAAAALGFAANTLRLKRQS